MSDDNRPKRAEPRVLLRGEFNPKVKSYWLLQPTVAFACSIVLIPLIPVYLIIANMFVSRWLAAMECRLTERSLIIKKGVFNRVESTIPLEKITDLQMYQGPIMRYLGLKGFKVETAGQSAGPGAALVNVVGLVDTDGFRDAVLERRDELADGPATKRGAAADRGVPSAGGDALLAVVAEIRDSLRRIEERLGDGQRG